MNPSKLSPRVWASLIVFGLFGQLAWTVENMYFNVYVYNTITGNTTVIASMVAFSAITATLTTLFMGALSDKVGKRKIFICAGYIIWGFTTFAFSLITVHNTSVLFPAANAVMLAGVFVVIMDCVMTFFGSTANDAAFNAWITDVTEPQNRGKTETVLAIMPLLAMVVVFGALAPLTMQGKWTLFFAIVGGLTSLGGIAGLFIIKDKPGLKAASGNYLSNIIYGFRPSTVRANKKSIYHLLRARHNQHGAAGVYAVSTDLYREISRIFQLYSGHCHCRRNCNGLQPELGQADGSGRKNTLPDPTGILLWQVLSLFT